MLFQALDSKNDCVGVYMGGELYFDSELPEDLSKTWSYAPYLPDVEYASLYVGGRTLDEVCPAYLKEDWDRVRTKLRAFYRSFVLAKVNLDENCFFDLVDPQFLVDFCELKNRICSYVFKKYERPKNYDFLLGLTKVLSKMEQQPLNIDFAPLKKRQHQKKVRYLMKKYAQINPYCRYNIFGTKTGRLTTRRDSFPILTMDRDFRDVIKPHGDWLVEFDYNAAELRTMLFLAAQEQPRGDLHEWNMSNVFRDGRSREKAKLGVFSWLFDELKTDKRLESVYRRDEIRNKYWDGDKVANPFGRTIAADHHHSLSYLIQSTTADIVFRKLIEIANFLENKESRVSFTIHDAIILDIVDKERYIIPVIKDIMTDNGFEVNIKAGKDFGNLRTLNL